VNDGSYVHFRLRCSRHSRRSTSFTVNAQHCGSTTRQWLFLMIYRREVNLPGSAIVVAAPTLWRDCGKDSAQHLLKPFTIPYLTQRRDQTSMLCMSLTCAYMSLTSLACFSLQPLHSSIIYGTCLTDEAPSNRSLVLAPKPKASVARASHALRFRATG
jgi:hypothetical protein